MKIPIAKVSFTEKEKEAILKTIETGWIVQGPFVKEFEEKWCEFTGASNSIAVTSCTTALHLSLVALNVGFDDEIIVPAFTWIATANVIEHVGAKPVFCDIDVNTFNIDVNKIESLITQKTKAIIPVHLFGMPAEIDKILELAEKYHLYVIEDAACGFGSKYNNKHVGSFGKTGCFSFHPRKALTTGEGGMITTNDSTLADKLRAMRDHGAGMSDLQRHLGAKPYLLPEFNYAGFNYRMTDIQASLGASQMERAEETLNKRKAIAEEYDKAFQNIDWLKPTLVATEYEHGYQAYVCLFKPEDITIENVDGINEQRNTFMEYLQENGISTRPGTHALHLLNYYKGKYNIESNDFPSSLIADKCSIALPIFSELSNDELSFIIEKIGSYNLL